MNKKECGKKIVTCITKHPEMFLLFGLVGFYVHKALTDETNTEISQNMRKADFYLKEIAECFKKTEKTNKDEKG